MSINSSMILSFYKEIAQLGSGSKFSVVQNTEDGKIYIKKQLSTYDLRIFEELKEHPVPGIPRICALHEEYDILYAVEEYVSGFTVEETLLSNGAMPEPLAINYIRKLTEIVRRLHSFNPPIIHRDIKPENVMITSAGNIYLLDLNVSKFEDRSKKTDTRLLGTVGYAAPEQYGFGSSDVRTDIYGIGILLKTMLTNGDSNFVIQKKTDAFIKKCTDLNPERRFQNIELVINSLRRL
ncbi:MAG: serine/threonine protein kinase [Lachnospiraceae bacterium]|nr:serine/threonine protein kinase [Lachnospiraceae bacterium]